ncbi:MAG: glycine cleavage system aminomethyltransferase GcvT [Gemmatimonadetes bacterium]|nr:glycine cleavage system aminomethyltransferase GcvT [Gemmatimonadota bacterium]MYD25765.1 glycine cleavage system aminomethyltransferase GcvT [Gemmatimonadota bacterium]MYJ00189.1 glycine cleavage system aminomethyltransferase GcvT [Gemmatimonadota bacterium]
MAELQKTALYDRHLALGAKLVPFSGWEMPVQYEGILAEHHAVRTAAGLFDVSHMGRVEISGPDAVAFANHVTVNDVERLKPYRSQYTLACRTDGGVIDDFLVYRMPDRLLVVPNAGNREKDLDWFRSHAVAYDVEIRDLSQESMLIALQGPRSEQILDPLAEAGLDSLRFQGFVETRVGGIDARVFRTGYTGEDGFEIWYPAEHAAALWDLLLESGASGGLKPCGLGARDTLRLEAGLALYGHEIDESINPIEAGLGWTVKLKKPDFIGRDALLGVRREGVKRKLVGLKLLERGIPRQGYEILHDRVPVGRVVSGAISPTLGLGIGTGFVPAELAEPGADLAIGIRGRHIAAEVVKLPFYTGSRK